MKKHPAYKGAKMREVKQEVTPEKTKQTPQKKQGTTKDPLKQVLVSRKMDTAPKKRKKRFNFQKLVIVAMLGMLIFGTVLAALASLL